MFIVMELTKYAPRKRNCGVIALPGSQLGNLVGTLLLCLNFCKMPLSMRLSLLVSDRVTLGLDS